MKSSSPTAAAIAPGLTGDIATRLQQIMVGWRGADRGESLPALHTQCRDAAGPGGRALVPDRLVMVARLDEATLRATLGRPAGPHRIARAEFRVPIAGRFDAALVPAAHPGQAPDRWILAIDDALPLHDQVALYAHALGHLLLNREVTQMGRIAPLDPRDGYTHVDTLGELRQLESTRNPIDRRVMDAYPALAALLRPAEDTLALSAVVPDLRRRLVAAGWRGHLVTAPYVFTDGRVFVSGSSFRRGARLRADALLRAEASLPIALVQAQRLGEARTDAERRVVDYARDRLGLPFAYLIAENGEVREFDWTGGAEATTTTVPELPPRDALWDRWIAALGLTDERAWAALRYPYHLAGGQTPRYYQETAINRAIIAVLQARRGLRRPRILLTLATGTGKTLVAFQIVWKLRRANAIGNVLFLTDRDYLLGQAMDKAFAPFGQARDRIRGEARTSRDVLFATYQSLAGEEARPGLYRSYPRDFFSLVIVDECHRGSAQDESNWRSILEHFDEAVQIGLTATPLRTDNVQTYEYFGKSVATYSLRLGITDGFLAPYRVRRVLMGKAARSVEHGMNGPDTPAAGLPIAHDPIAGDGHGDMDLAMAEEEPAATLVEYTEVIADHLARYLEDSGDPMAKTIVFCVDQAHAERMRLALERACAVRVARYPDYVERIVADEGTEGKRALGRFSTPDEPTPVVVTTSKLLSTGVDVPTCKNIVLARPVGSIVEFKQIIGRGTRLHEPDKTWFTILDYAGATRHFFDPDFDGDPETVEIEVLAPRPQPAATADEGTAADAAPEFGGEMAPAAAQPGGMYDERGDRAFPDSIIKDDIAPMGADPPSREMGTAGDIGDVESGTAGATDTDGPHQPDTNTLDTATERLTAGSDGGGARATADTPGGAPSPQPPIEPGYTQPPGPELDAPIVPIRPGDGRRVVVRGEIVYELGPDGRTLRTLSPQRYRDYTRSIVEQLCPGPAELRARWLRDEQREEIRARLEEAGIDLGELAVALHQPEADPLDLLMHIAFDRPPLTRRERAERLWREHTDFFARYGNAARDILRVILEKYVRGEAPDVSDPDLLRVPPLLERGTFMELAQPFGGGARLRAALKEMQALLYAP